MVFLDQLSSTLLDLKCTTIQYQYIVHTQLALADQICLQHLGYQEQQQARPGQENQIKSFTPITFRQTTPFFWLSSQLNQNTHSNSSSTSRVSLPPSIDLLHYHSNITNTTTQGGAGQPNRAGQLDKKNRKKSSFFISEKKEG